MTILIKYVDDTIQLVTGSNRLRAELDVSGKATVTHFETGETFEVKEVNGSYVRAAPERATIKDRLLPPNGHFIAHMFLSGNPTIRANLDIPIEFLDVRTRVDLGKVLTDKYMIADLETQQKISAAVNQTISDFEYERSRQEQRTGYRSPQNEAKLKAARETLADGAPLPENNDDLSDLQKLVAANYCDGEFVETTKLSEVKLAGDTLFTFCVLEAGDADNAEHFHEMLATAIRHLESLQASLNVDRPRSTDVNL